MKSAKKSKNRYQHIQQMENELKTKHLRYQDAYGAPHPDKEKDLKELQDTISNLLIANNWYCRLIFGGE